MLNRWQLSERRQASALVSALVLLIVVTMICFALVLQFARWQGEYRDERLKTEQLMVQLHANKNSADNSKKARP
jgi:type II secretory pathway component PulK